MDTGISVRRVCQFRHLGLHKNSPFKAPEGIEPSFTGFVDRCVVHYATEPPTDSRCRIRTGDILFVRQARFQLRQSAGSRHEESNLDLEFRKLASSPLDDGDAPGKKSPGQDSNPHLPV